MASSPEQQSAVQHGPPFPPTTQSLGEVPSILPDVPINAVFLFIFVLAAAGHMGLFLRNMKSGKKFILNAAVFGFCMTRIIGTSLRIAWACHSTLISVGIAAAVFVYAGTIILFIANLIFAQRIVRAQQPRFGWSKPFSFAFPILFIIIGATIVCLIAAVILMFYTLDPSSQRVARDIQLYGLTMYAVVAFLPIPIVGISALVGRRQMKTVDDFGEGSMGMKLLIVLLSSALLCLGASYRAGTSLLPPVPIEVNGRLAPHPWYLSKASFYSFNFAIESIIVIFWLIMRIDKRFFVPNGAHGPDSYAGGFESPSEPGIEKIQLRAQKSTQQSLTAPFRKASRGFTSKKYDKEENQISWGGLLQEGTPVLGEDGKQLIPYPEPVAHEHAEEAGKEMGWDAESGKWALRPVSRALSTTAGQSAIVSPLSTAPPTIPPSPTSPPLRSTTTTSLTRSVRS